MADSQDICFSLPPGICIYLCDDVWPWATFLSICTYIYIYIIVTIHIRCKDLPNEEHEETHVEAAIGLEEPCEEVPEDPVPAKDVGMTKATVIGTNFLPFMYD